MNNVNNYGGQIPQQFANYQQVIPNEYKPISAWGYLGYNLLFSIPLIGFIFLLIFALGGTQNINLRNYARSYFCAMLVAFIFICFVFIFAFLVYSSM